MFLKQPNNISVADMMFVPDRSYFLCMKVKTVIGDMMAHVKSDLQSMWLSCFSVLQTFSWSAMGKIPGS